MTTRDGRRRRAINQRAMTFGALALVILAAVLTSLVWGLPLDRTRSFLWVALALGAVSLGNLRGWVRGMVVDWLPLFVLLFVYDVLRGRADALLATVHYRPQIDADRWLFGPVPTVWLQQHFWHPGHPYWYDFAGWFVYTSHFVVSVVICGVLWKVGRPRFRRFMACLVTLSFAALLTYALYPAAPPWLASRVGDLPTTTRIISVVWHHGIYQGPQDTAELLERYGNPVAAMPSLHAAIPLMICLFFWATARVWQRVLMLAYVVAMAGWLVYGAEHYVIDIFAGWAYAIVTVASLQLCWRWRERQRAAATARTNTAAVPSESAPTPV